MENLKHKLNLLGVGCLCLLLAGCSPGEQLPEMATATPDAPLETPAPTDAPEVTSMPQEPAATPTLSPVAEAFLGEWINLEQDGGGFSWFSIRQDGAEAVAHFWGQCSPEACDIGEHRFPVSDLDDGQFVFSYDFANGTNSSEIVLKEDLSVEITVAVDFSEASGGEDRTIVRSFQNSLEVSGIPAYIGTWVYDHPLESEFSYLSIALVNGELVIHARALIEGQEFDLGQVSWIDDIDDDGFYVDYEYPGGGLISGEILASGEGTLTVSMFTEHMVDDVYTSHEAVITMRRVE
jgi:hypothetical protein